jgi:hypothetical protein
MELTKVTSAKTLITKAFLRFMLTEIGFHKTFACDVKRVFFSLFVQIISFLLIIYQDWSI